MNTNDPINKIHLIEFLNDVINKVANCSEVKGHASIERGIKHVESPRSYAVTMEPDGTYKVLIDIILEDAKKKMEKAG